MLANAVPAFFGFYMGLLVWTSTIRWIYSIWQVATERSAAGQGKFLPGASVLLLHSGPWLLIAAAAFAYYILSRPHEPWWFWFFVGSLFAPVLSALRVAFVMRCLKQSKAKVGQL
jgi:phosphotransferase system  glucose/maltose/N-acetylglucosamine-specific IIC component